ncbi:TetR/AcrR family transcriptional regulator [Variovorax sp. dw_954]|uniref:TetR/AcrR family transcriptional regulator n=1 Tax=Variovorax sp. dw_954 TaxID=2720078 RepID=UPI001BD36126|nr:TetR/AcrR family transcriptional regulator [Variovorax sp. dw_954]
MAAMGEFLIFGGGASMPAFRKSECRIVKMSAWHRSVRRQRMQASSGAPSLGAGDNDHRVQSALRKRERTRKRILDATVRVFVRRGDDMPVIEDVVREAGISRGTFYQHFPSLDDALRAASTGMNERMIAEILPLYDCLKEPWQRAAVGFRLFLIRAWQDPDWAAFVTRMNAWPRDSLVATYMARDLERGSGLGQFHIDDAQTACDFLMGASAGGIQGVRSGVADPHAYMDISVRMALQSLGCSTELRERGVEFSRRHLDEWISGQRLAWRPLAGSGREDHEIEDEA